MGTRRNITVSRSYEPQADACLQALITLLKPVSSEGGPSLVALADDAKESNGCIAIRNHSK